jgi:molybdopterin-guanine dinucleotide biosynthesis protein MobB
MAGAREVALVSANRWALMHELRGAPEPTISEILGHLSPVDLVLIEGYKRGDHPKIEAHRAEAGRDLLAPCDPTIRAVASDAALTGLTAPLFHLDDTKGIADFILRELGL